MKIPRLLMLGTMAAVISLASHAVVVGQQSLQPLTVALSDPGRPGTLELNVVSGGATIKGTNRRDMLIEAHSRGDEPSRGPRGGRFGDSGAAGLRRLTQAPGFDVEEARNIVKIDAGPPNHVTDFDIQVPLKTNLKLSLVNNATLTVSDIDGELELENVNGPITLINVGGSVVAHTVNGKVTATLIRVMPDKPMAFTSLNGGVDVTLPSSVKANFKLRSDNGDVYSDFDIQLRPNASAAQTRRDGGKLRIEVNNAIYGAVNGGGPEFEMRTFNGNVYVRKGR